jgi:hypothetical protein
VETAVTSSLNPSRLLGVVASGAALAVVAGTVAPAVASATDGTPPAIYGVLSPVQAGAPILFGYFTQGDPTCSVTDGALPAGVTLDPTACELRGTPFIGGLYTFTVTASNSVGPDASVQSALEVDSLSGGGYQELDPVLDQPFDQHVFDLDYPSPTFSLDDPTDLPDGLTLDPDGRLHGTPTSLQHADTLSLRATNVLGSSLSDLAIRVQPATAAVTGTPDPATAGTFYSFQFGWTGAAHPTFSLASGQLPTGFVLYSDGTLAGTPQEPTPGTQFTVTATDGVATASEDVTLVVDPSAPTISRTPTAATRARSYGFDYALTGIPRPTTTVTSGSLPPGLSLNTDGDISGVPSTDGHYEFTVTATNGSATDATITSVIDVSDATIVLGGTPPAGTVGTPYSFQFTAEGTPQPTVTASGNLPRGLTLSPSGLLSGTPTTAGTYAFTVTAANGGVDPSQSSSITLRIGTTTPTVSIAGHRATEGNSGRKAFTFTVSLSSPSPTPVTVHWATANGTAKAGSDYVARSGTLTFAPGQTTKTVTVQVKGDRTKEATEAFTVRLSRPGHARLGQASATGTIVNDD